MNAIPQARAMAGSGVAVRLAYALPIILLPNSLHFPDKVALGLSLGSLLFAVMLLRRRDPLFLGGSSALMAPFVGLFIALAVAFMIANWNDMSHAGSDLMRAKNAVLYPLVYIIYRRCGMDLVATRQLIALVMIVVALAALEAVFQGLHFDLGRFDETQRAYGPFGDGGMANRAGVFFAMFLPMFVTVVIQASQRPLHRALAAIGALVLVAGIAFTFSRQSYLIALVGIALLLARRHAPLALLSLVLLAMGVGFLPESVIQRVSETRQVDASGAASYDGSTASRPEIWKGALEMFTDHPAGVGLGRFPEHIGDYSKHAGMDAHNTFILVMAECGAFGLTMVLWLVWRVWKLASWLRRGFGKAPSEARTLALGFSVSVVSMFLGNMYGTPFFEGLVMFDFWILCALVERYGVIRMRDSAFLFASRRAYRPVVLASRFPLAARALPGMATVGGLLPRQHQ